MKPWLTSSRISEKFSTIILFLVIASYVTVGDSALPDHYNDLEQYLLSRMNFSADPCNDFHTYACGNSDNTITHMVLENKRILKTGLDNFISTGQRNYSEASAYGKALRLYEACVNENITKAEADAHTKEGVNVFLNKFNFPADFFFNDNATVEINREKFSDILKYVHDTFFVEPFFHIYGAPSKAYGKKDSKNYGILGFTAVRSSFEETVYECNSSKLLKKFIDSVQNGSATMGLKATEDKIEETAQELMEFELRLRGIPCGNNITITRKGNYFNLESLTFEHFGIDLNNYVRSLVETGIGNRKIDSMLFVFDSLREVLESTSVADLLRYIYFRIVNKNAVEIDCVDTLTPLKLVKSRIYTESKYTSVGEREYFSDGTTFIDVVDSVKENLRNMILTVPWIQQDADVYDRLSRKFLNMRAEVAIENNLWNNTYLDEYYDQLRFNDNDNFFDMYSKAQQFDMYGKVRSILRDATDIEYDSTIINGGYMNALNKIIINDGYLVAPNYHKTYEISYNFGSIAGAIGHEISHGVDLRGMQYDENGFWRPVLNGSTKIELEKMKNCVVDQYDGIQVLPGNYTKNYVNGSQTFVENMADISGFEAASRAFAKLKRDGKLSEKPSFNHPKLRGLTHDQLFFLGLVNPFCSKQDVDLIHYYVTTDPHTPNIARAQVLTNIPAFGKAFHCPVGSKYRPTEYCRVWTTSELALIDLFLSLTSIFFNVFEQ